MSFSNDIADKKREFRQFAKNELKKLSSQFDRDTRSMMATVHFTDSLLYRGSSSLFTFISKKTEINTQFLIEKAFSDGKDIAVPRVNGKSLDFYYLSPEEPLDTQLETAAFGIKEPLTTLEKVDTHHLPIDSVFILPGLAFASDGTRLGYGKGFYDTFISTVYETVSPLYFPKALVGFCFNCQLFDNLPQDEHDVPLTHIITEERIISC